MAGLTEDDFTLPNSASTNTELAPITTATESIEYEGESFSSEEVAELMATDLDFFASVVLPEEVTAPFSPLHRNVWALLTEAVRKNKDVDKYAVGIPRGHAKTFLLKLLCLYCVLFTKRRFILVVCSTATLAESFVADVADLLDTEVVQRIFGDWRSDIENDSQTLKKFYFQGRDIIIKPTGKGGSLRGTNMKFRRPDMMICDDIQTLEESYSVEQSKQLLQWLLGTLLKARDPKVCTVIYLGNMYPDVPMGDRQAKESDQMYTCILRNLQRNSEWISWVTGGVLSDGTALWEEVHPLQSLLSDLRQDTAMGQSEIWFAEIQNDPSAVSSRWIDVSKIPQPEYTSYDLVIGKYLVIDPSLGKKKSDDQIVGLFYVYDDSGPVLREVRNIQKSAPELVKEVLTWALEENIPLIAAESVAYQATLIQWFAHFIDLLGIDGLNITGVTPKGMSKQSRILAYFKSLMAGTSKLHPDTRDLVIAQAQLYRPDKSNNIDDILDVGAYGEDCFIQFGTEYLLPLEAIYTPSSGAKSQVEDTGLLPSMTGWYSGSP